LKDSTPNVLSNGSGSRPSHSSHPPPTVSPTKYAAFVCLNYVRIFCGVVPYKCQQCSKRYKTTAGLSNHVEQSHKKQSGRHYRTVYLRWFTLLLSGGCGTPSSTDSAPASPSPAVLDQLISQARAHGQATAAQEQLVHLEFLLYSEFHSNCFLLRERSRGLYQFKWLVHRITNMDKWVRLLTAFT
uniref:C2H2-type domain-containing protein n=1 Tax=Heligmosomoides polygyrus TaxID=6339 RepID=A0A183GNG9_HELPZ